MIAVSIAAILAPLALGTLATTALWSRRETWVSSLPLLFGIGAGLGLVITSTVFFAASLVSSHPGRLGGAIELLAALAIALRLWWRPKEPDASPGGFARHWRPSLGILALATLFAQACVASLVVAARNWEAQPFGGWDAWAIWNLHARLMFFGGEKWPDLLRSPQIVWSHPDYPLLLPAAAARTWSNLGRMTPEAPAVISMAFGVATMVLLLSSVAHLRSRAASMIGGLVLLGTPFFVTFSTSQYADVPLGYLILATLVMLVLSERAPKSRGMGALAGAFAGMAAWAKNEGWLFVLVAVLVWGASRWRRGSLRDGIPFLGGLAVALVPVLLFKIAMAPPNDLIASRPIERLGFLGDGERHRLVLAALWRHSERFGEWRFAPHLALLLPLLAGPWRRMTPAERGAGAAVILMLAGYYVVYLLTPKDPAWHVENSIDRLLLQLWPATLLFWCLAAFGRPSSPSLPSGSAGFAGRARARLALFAGLNAAAACMVLGAFGGQLAPNELAATRGAGGEVRAVTGAGWFQREEDGRDTWAWSSGAAMLELIPHGWPEAAPVKLRFGMRSLSDCTVTARVDGRIIWSARIGRDMSQWEAAVPMSKGRATDIAFSSDEPGVRESASSTARSLAFAIYDLRLVRQR